MSISRSRFGPLIVGASWVGWLQLAREEEGRFWMRAQAAGDKGSVAAAGVEFALDKVAEQRGRKRDGWLLLQFAASGRAFCARRCVANGGSETMTAMREMPSLHVERSSATTTTTTAGGGNRAICGPSAHWLGFIKRRSLAVRVSETGR